MNKISDKTGNLLRLIAPATAALSIVAIAPYLLMDSVNPIKFFLTSAFALGFLIILIMDQKGLLDIRPLTTLTIENLSPVLM